MQRLLQRFVVGAEPGQEEGVDTGVFAYAEVVKVRVFGAGGKGERMRPGAVHRRHALRETAYFLFRGGAESGMKRVQVSCRLTVHIHKAEDQFFRKRRERAAHAVHAVQNFRFVESSSQNDGVESPDDAVRPESVGQTFKGVEADAHRGKMRLQTFFFVIVERELEVKGKACGAYGVEVFQKRGRIFAPEDESTCFFKGNETFLTGIEGIFPAAETGVQPPHEPCAVEGGNIRGAACGNDERCFRSGNVCSGHAVSCREWHTMSRNVWGPFPAADTGACRTRLTGAALPAESIRRFFSGVYALQAYVVFLSDAEESGKNLREAYLHEYGQARVFFLQIGFRVQECVGADPA